MAQYPKGTYLEYRDEEHHIVHHIYDLDKDGGGMLYEIIKSNHPNHPEGEKGKCSGCSGWTDITKEYKVLEILRKWRDENMFSCETIRNT